VITARARRERTIHPAAFSTAQKLRMVEASVFLVRKNKKALDFSRA